MPRGVRRNATQYYCTCACLTGTFIAVGTEGQAMWNERNRACIIPWYKHIVFSPRLIPGRSLLVLSYTLYPPPRPFRPLFYGCSYV